jgi:hypothetical protein
MFNRLFFLDDPFRKEFLLALFRQNLLHATILRLNEDIIASNVGVTGKNWVHLQGINTHAPQYARYSPGILHFLLMGKLLAGEGVEVFDLTPGADAYKDSLATDSGQAYELKITNSYNRLASNIKNKLVHYIKTKAQKAGLRPEALRKIKWQASLLKERMQNASQQGWLPILSGFFTQTRAVKPMKVYRIKPEGQLHPAAGPIHINKVNKDSLSDLLGFEQQQARCTRWEFLADAMRRFESGDQSYTWSESGRLLGCVWLRGPRPSPDRVMPGTALPEGAAVLEGFYCHQTGRARWQDFLQAVACQVATHRQAAYVFATTPARDTTICTTLEASGFREAPAAE